jgi:hypothetical protein
MVAIGKKLVEVKGRVGHGKYERFIRERLRFGKTAAHCYVKSYELLKCSPGEDFQSLQIDAKALYLLARPNTPEEVRTEALEKAAGPNGISRDEVAALVEQAKQQAAAKATAEAQQLRRALRCTRNSGSASADLSTRPMAGTRPVPRYRDRRSLAPSA